MQVFFSFIRQFAVDLVARGSYCLAVDMKGALDATASSGHCETKAHGSVKRTILELMRPRNFGGFFVSTTK